MNVLKLQGFIGIVGDAIEEIVAARERNLVDETQRMCRQLRDRSMTHHITLVDSSELKMLKENGIHISSLIESFSEKCCNSKPIVLGIGSVSQEQRKAIFIALSWETMNQARKSLKLEPKDFHITVGLQQGDVHGIRKNASTLLKRDQSFSIGALNAMFKAAMKLDDLNERENILCAIEHHGLYSKESENVVFKSLLARARLHATLGNFKAVVEIALKTTSVKAVPRAYLTLGDAYQKYNDKRSAKMAYRKGLELCTSSFFDVREIILKRLEKINDCSIIKEKFPRTEHLFNLGAATRDDLLIPVADRELFCLHSVHIEEKVDGANLGMWFDEMWQLQTINRSRRICSDMAPQWAGLQIWIDAHQKVLYEMLGQRFALYGEWMYAKHTILYDNLPGIFLAFDVYDRVARRFLSVSSRNEILARGNIPIIRTVFHGKLSIPTMKQELLSILDSTKSAYRDGLMEGIVIRSDELVEEDRRPSITFLERRTKLVRPEFMQDISKHWTSQSVIRNKVRFERMVCETPLKYPSTPHLPFSPAIHSDDKIANTEGLHSLLCSKRIIITEKLDGGNCCLKGGQVYSRTHSQPASHWSFGIVKQLYESILTEHAEMLDKVQLFGENMSAIHSITYDQLCSPFYLFGVRDIDSGTWHSWDQVTTLAEKIGVPTVPLVFDGAFTRLEQIHEMLKSEAALVSRASSEVPGEGFVIRVAESFEEAAFSRSVFKYVRENHIQTQANWKMTCQKAKIVQPLNDQKISVRPPRSDYPIQLYVDLDGTLADFDSKIEEITGKKPGGQSYTSLWRTVESEKNFFGSLDWMPGAQAMWEEHLVSLHPTILSGIPMSSTHKAKKQKQGWCASHLGPQVPTILCASRDKALYSGPGRVLIDDRIRIKRHWEKAGGIFIHHTSPTTTIAALQNLNLFDDSKPTKPTKNEKPRKKKKCKYKLIVLVGLPGAGKSTLAKQITELSTCATRVCQDEVGSREECENLVGRLIKKGTVVVDRCNVTKTERKRWLDLAMVNGKDACIIHLNTDLEECVNRITQRVNHPTIKTNNPDAARRIANSFKKSFEEPEGNTEGFGAVFTVDRGEGILAKLGF